MGLRCTWRHRVGWLPANQQVARQADREMIKVVEQGWDFEVITHHPLHGEDSMVWDGLAGWQAKWERSLDTELTTPVNATQKLVVLLYWNAREYTLDSAHKQIGWSTVSYDLMNGIVDGYVLKKDKAGILVIFLHKNAKPIQGKQANYHQGLATIHQEQAPSIEVDNALC